MRNRLALTALLLAAPLPALAHVTLGEPNAMPGAAYTAHFHVGHGCGGSPTVALTISIPNDVAAVEPAPPPGWTIATVRSGGRISAVTWKGGKLAADKPGEFVLTMKLPSQPGVLGFPATQTCAGGVENWSEMPAADGHHLDHPAPILTLAAMPMGAATPMNMPMASNAPTPLKLEDGWIRLLPGTLPAGGYFTLRNSGTAKIALTGADSPACGMLMLHKSEDKGGMSSMADVKEVDVPGGGTLAFAPGGYHLMCMDARPMLKQGASVPVTLSFKGAPPLTARFEVRGATGK